MKAWILIATDRSAALCDWNSANKRLVEVIRYMQPEERAGVVEAEATQTSEEFGQLRRHAAREAGLREFLESVGVVLEGAAAWDHFQRLVLVASPRLRLSVLKTLGPRAASRLSEPTVEELLPLCAIELEGSSMRPSWGC
ncbi:MAG: hypothetical protein EBZ48_01130 [Proteobacteria bacterium]|nr:hypothetical protein [Pseudomonadota bacterium]